MYISASLLAAAMLSIAHAQTPQGFTPAATTNLDVIFNSTSVKKPGQLLAKAAVASQPELALPESLAKADGTFMFVMLDLDVPPEQGATKRRVLLHALNTDLKVTKQKVNGTAAVLASSQKGPAPYLSPGPPATDTVAHRYVQLLFQQPATLKVQASAFSNTTARIGFDINKFMTEQGLSKPVAGNFFTVDGKASNSTSGTGGSGSASKTGARGTATSTGAQAGKTTPAQFQGAAGRFETTIWAVIALALLPVFAL